MTQEKRPTAETFTAIPRVRHYCQHLASDIGQYTKTVMDEVVDKAFLGRENGQYCVVHGR